MRHADASIHNNPTRPGSRPRLNRYPKPGATIIAPNGVRHTVLEVKAPRILVADGAGKWILQGDHIASAGWTVVR